ncbi:MAG: hypothetical protein A3G41_06280 [Elusimicrobia bacterium RIFCSPLOWO2_12_FULL_59_9]|nr:MAG: hypothetical protein A3G41_06280 [Elusimicrobia bacterium RIFCSPLOWO2_12_FULL_59_9]
MKNFSNPRCAGLFSAAALYLSGSACLRALLWSNFSPPGAASSSALLPIFSLGLRMDLSAAAWLFLPWALWITFLPENIFASRPYRALAQAAFIAYAAFQLFFFGIEWYFFDEFNSRLNNVAVDYLIYPHEVFINIAESYPVAGIAGACLLAGALLYAGLRTPLRSSWSRPSRLGERAHFLAVYLLLWILLTQTVSLKDTRFSQDRVLDEISSNGAYSLIYAAHTRDLDFAAFYRTMDTREAYRRTRKLLSQPEAVFDPGDRTIQRRIPGGRRRRPMNLVILLVESFGSEFWGCLGNPGPSWTPRMDGLSKKGLLFTHLYASGNRTVRGMEGVLSAFPPLPGDSIVKRHLSDQVATLARTVKDQGYQTLFLYGGRGIFDGMKSFTTRNGFDRFIEQKDFPRPVFSTIWGVSDEDLVGRAIEEFRGLESRGRPFLGVVLTVSNHKPYTYPAGRIPEDPNPRSRQHAVKYTDWALGEFFRRAEKERFYQDTLFAVVADHGARVYGSPAIPIHSYEIPLLVLGPSVKKPSTVDTLGSSVDVGPTLLGLMGIAYRSVFFGRDLLKMDRQDGWAVLNHNRDIGLYRNGRMAVLGLNKTVEFYRVNPGSKQLEVSGQQDEEDRRLEKDAIALFQVADDLYVHKNYFVR